MLLGIMLGVAVMVAIDIANASASRAFDLSTQAIAGRATHQITAANGLSEELYVRLRTELGWEPAAPVIESAIVAPDLDGHVLTLLGVDPLAEGPFRQYMSAGPDVSMAALAPFFARPNSALISTQLAERYGLRACPWQANPDPACTLRAEIEGRERTLIIVGLLDPSDSLNRRAVADLVLTDIATAQELTGRLGRIDRIDLILPEGAAGEAQAEALRAWLPPSVRLQTVAARTGAIKQMTAAFRVNLAALSLLALLVGVFLIYNAMTFSVVQRRPLFGILRALGMTRRELFGLVVLEAALLGIVGAALGLLLGALLGQGAVKLVTRSINDLFFVVAVRGVQTPVSSLIKGGVVGVAATILAAAPPAWEAGSISPRLALERSGLEQKARHVIQLAALGGVLGLILGVGVLAIPTRNLIVSFTGAFIIILGAALLTPGAMILFMRAVTPLTAKVWGLLGRMAPRDVVAALSRTAIAVAVLMIAVAVTIGVTLMVGSFRYTVATWLDQVLRGDVYISAPGGSNSQPGPPLDPAIVEQVKANPEVLRAASLRTLSVESPQGPLRLDAIDDYAGMNPELFLAKEGTTEDLWQAMEAGAVVISEPLANRLGLPRHGGSLVLDTANGPQTFPIAGIYYDYTTPQGAVRMSLDVYRRLWGDDAVNGLSLTLAPGADPDQVAQDLQVAVQGIQHVQIRPQRALRDLSLQIFDRTFIITQAMQLLTTLVAFIGVLSTLMALQLERQRQYGILRALGMTGRESFRLILLQSGLMGAVAGLLAMPTGYALALILIYIINQRSFGWTLQMHVTPGPFLVALIVAISAALLAGLYPALRLLRRTTAQTIRRG